MTKSVSNIQERIPHGKSINITISNKSLGEQNMPLYNRLVLTGRSYLFVLELQANGLTFRRILPDSRVY